MRTYVMEDRNGLPLYEHLYRCIRRDILDGTLGRRGAAALQAGPGGASAYLRHDGGGGLPPAGGGGDT